jgi:hypothetical protein
MARLGTVRKIVLLAMLFGWVVLFQLAYDITKPTSVAGAASGLSPATIRIIDMGFHSTVASFLWVSTMPEIVDLFHGNREYLSDEAFVNAVDPKLSYPYAFSVLTLPAVPTSQFPDRIVQATAIGQAGLLNADADWRIPYYMAINYYLELHDLQHATQYFNIAADTKGVPDYAKRFSLNFGVGQRERDRVRNLWITVYQSAKDDDTKARAAAYVARLNMLDYLDTASTAYKQKFGTYPATPDELVTKQIISAVPVDPFGFTFVINKDGTSGIDTTKPIPTAPQPGQ